MKELKDEHLLNSYLQQYKIPDLFDTKNLPFQLYEYEAGEIMNYKRPLDKYLKFIVSGEISLYALMEDGEQFTAFQGPHIGLLGDLELCGVKFENNYQEALTTVHSIELPLAKVKSQILDDNSFLRYLLYRIVKRHIQMTKPELVHSTSVENRLLHYLEYESNEHSFSGVEAMAFRLRCSRSQVQRALKTLVQNGQIQKIGKGKYKLIQEVH